MELVFTGHIGDEREHTKTIVQKLKLEKRSNIMRNHILCIWKQKLDKIDSNFLMR